jgi:hypothetical protein
MTKVILKTGCPIEVETELWMCEGFVLNAAKVKVATKSGNYS